MATWNVKLKIEAWAEIEVEADDEVEAIDAAKDKCIIDDLDDWEPTHGYRDHEGECLDCDEDEELEEESDEE